MSDHFTKIDQKRFQKLVIKECDQSISVTEMTELRLLDRIRSLSSPDLVARLELSEKQHEEHMAMLKKLKEALKRIKRNEKSHD